MATISLNLNAQGIKAGARDAKQSLDSVKQSATSTEAAVVRSGNNMGSAITRMGNMSGAQRFVFQNTANQLGDIAVQASMGTNIFRVLGMQLPQIAGGFAILGGAMGTVLPILGVIAAVGFPIIAMFTSMSGAADTFDDKLENLRDTISAMEKAQGLLNMGLTEAEDRFGILTHSVQVYAKAQADLALNEVARNLRSLGAELAAVGSKYESVGRKGRRLNRSVQEIRKEFDLTSAEAKILQAAFDDFSASMQSADLTKMDEGTKNLVQTMYDLGVSLEETENDALLGFTQSMVDFGIEAATARKLAEELRAGILSLDVPKPVFPDPEEIVMGQFLVPDPEGMRNSYNAGQKLLIEERKKAAKEAQAALDKEKRELESFAEKFEPVMTAAAEYEETMTKLNRAREIGAITEEQHAQATAVATDKYRIAAGELVDYTNVANIFANSLENSMMQLVQGTLSVEDAFKNMALAVIKELYRVLVVQQIVNAAMGAFGFSPAAGGGFVPTGGAGAFGGPVSPSQGIVVGERGPEVFFPPSKGNLVPNSDLGGVQVHQSFNFAANGDESVKQIIAQQAPKIAKMTEQSIMESRRRGGQMKAVFG